MIKHFFFLAATIMSYPLVLPISTMERLDDGTGIKIIPLTLEPVILRRFSRINSTREDSWREALAVMTHKAQDGSLYFLYGPFYNGRQIEIEVTLTPDEGDAIKVRIGDQEHSIPTKTLIAKVDNRKGEFSKEEVYLNLFSINQDDYEAQIRPLNPSLPSRIEECEKLFVRVNFEDATILTTGDETEWQHIPHLADALTSQEADGYDISLFTVPNSFKGIEVVHADHPSRTFRISTSLDALYTEEGIKTKLLKDRPLLLRARKYGHTTLLAIQGALLTDQLLKACLFAFLKITPPIINRLAEIEGVSSRADTFDGKIVGNILPWGLIGTPDVIERAYILAAVIIIPAISCMRTIARMIEGKDISSPAFLFVFTFCCTFMLPQMSPDHPFTGPLLAHVAVPAAHLSEFLVRRKKRKIINRVEKLYDAIEEI